MSACGLCHQHSHITTCAFHADFISRLISAGQLSQVFPFHGIVRSLYLSLQRLFFPIQHNFVKRRTTAQIYIHPFLLVSAAHPCAGEILGRLQLHGFIFIKEVQFIDAPIHRAAQSQFQTIETIIIGFVEDNRFFQNALWEVSLFILLVGIRVNFPA